MNKLDEKVATLKMHLKNPETGYECKWEENVSPNQWKDINAIIAESSFPKWQEVNDIHSVNCVVNPGWYFLGMSDGRIEAKYIKKSIPAKWDYFMKVEVPEIP